MKIKKTIELPEKEIIKLIEDKYKIQITHAYWSTAGLPFPPLCGRKIEFEIK